jgi:hypothetical protein
MTKKIKSVVELKLKNQDTMPGFKPAECIEYEDGSYGFHQDQLGYHYSFKDLEQFTDFIRKFTRALNNVAGEQDGKKNP